MNACLSFCSYEGSLSSNWKFNFPSYQGRCQNIYTLVCKSDKSRFIFKIVISSLTVIHRYLLTVMFEEAMTFRVAAL